MGSWLAVGFAAVAFFSTVAGGLTALRWPGRVQALAALAGGVVLGAAFFDLLPDAIDRAATLHLSTQLPVGASLIGFLSFYTLERFLHHHHREDEGPDRGGLFVYAASIILLPRAKELSPQTALPLTLGGATAMFLITRLA